MPKEHEIERVEGGHARKRTPAALAAGACKRRFFNEHGKVIDLRVGPEDGGVVIIMSDDKSCMENVVTHLEATQLFYALGEYLNGNSFGVELTEPPKNPINDPQRRLA